MFSCFSDRAIRKVVHNLYINVGYDHGILTNDLILQELLQKSCQYCYLLTARLLPKSSLDMLQYVNEDQDFLKNVVTLYFFEESWYMGTIQKLKTVITMEITYIILSKSIAGAKQDEGHVTFFILKKQLICSIKPNCEQEFYLLLFLGSSSA